MPAVRTSHRNTMPLSFTYYIRYCALLISGILIYFNKVRNARLTRSTNAREGSRLIVYPTGNRGNIGYLGILTKKEELFGT